MMMHRKFHRVAALVLAMVLMLGLVACGGNGSGDQPQNGGQAAKPQGNDDSVDTVWYGLWVGEDEVLQIMPDEPIAFLFYLETDGFYMGAQNDFDKICGYNYTIHGNVLKLENKYAPEGYAPDDGAAPETMELTLDGDRLVCGDKVYTKFTDKTGSTETQQPPVSEPAAPVEPVQTVPVATEPVVSTDLSGFYGIWYSGSWLLEINSSYAIAYDVDDVDTTYGIDGRVFVSDIWDCSYVMEGSTMKMDCFDAQGNLMDSYALTLEGGYLCISGEPVFGKLTSNMGASGELVGTWMTVGERTITFSDGAFSNFNGTEMAFYNDGTCMMQFSDGSGKDSFNYYLTSKFDNPAFGIRADGIDAGSYEYDFMENDLLMIYTDLDRTEGFLLYRVS